jgi:hypothetical protein
MLGLPILVGKGQLQCVAPSGRTPVDHLDRHARAGEADCHAERDAATARDSMSSAHHLGPPTVVVDHQTDEVDPPEAVPHGRPAAADHLGRDRISGKHAHRIIVGTPFSP